MPQASLFHTVAFGDSLQLEAMSGENWRMVYNEWFVHTYIYIYNSIQSSLSR